MPKLLCPHCLQPLDDGYHGDCPHCGRSLDNANPEGALPLGTQLAGRYTVGGYLSADGDGLSYRGVLNEEKKFVLIKEYFPVRCQPQRDLRGNLAPLAGTKAIYQRGKNSFLSEASMVRAVSGLPSIVQVLDFFEKNNTAYMVMNYLDGVTLRWLVEGRQRFEPVPLLEKALPLMEDLGRLHRAGVLHRDIAPDNLMLMPDGSLTLLDFGCARSMEDGRSMTVVLKPGFAPIEQYQTRGQGPSTDVYALCASLYYCLTGQVPPAAPDRLCAVMEGGADPLAAPAALGVSMDGELERLLGIIHELEPAGIGARDLRECLLLQMAQMPVNTRPRRLARKILTSYFDEFVKKHYEKLMARLQISEDDFRDAIAEIRHLSPKPGNLYAEGGTDTTPYIIPDFILDYQDGRFNLSLNSYNVPEVRVNRRYMEMIREMVGSDGRVREKDKEAIQFVKNKIDSAKWFISAIKQRHDTLMRTMQTILDYQQEYFKDGDKSKLRPMILKDIADRTGLDVSTISRVVNSKYVQTQFGIILLKSLFSEAMQTDSGEEVSSYEIKNILQQCIDEEDKRRPLTDETLMDILNSKGYRIARRTVAKYREMLGIPVARLRKQI